MTRYPISHNGSKKIDEFFHEILTFHVPPSKDKVILDPTCGHGILWRKFFDGVQWRVPEYGRVIFSDIRDFGQDLKGDVFETKFDKEIFDAIVYDPPYFFGYSGSKDPRREEYGDFIQSYEELKDFMKVANFQFPIWLKKDGKLIVKCGDQFSLKDRMFYPLHIDWINTLSNYVLIDLFVFIHHHISPTAFQVKNRPCSVIMHTYFLVFKRDPNLCL